MSLPRNFDEIVSLADLLSFFSNKRSLPNFCFGGGPDKMGSVTWKKSKNSEGGACGVESDHCDNDEERD